MFTCLHSLKLQSRILYSTSVASKDVITDRKTIEFLVKAVGFSDQEAVSVVNKVSPPLKCTENFELVVDFLKENGLDGTQIRSLVARFPYMLRNNVDKTLKPKVGAFEDVGISGSDLGQIVSQFSNRLERSIESGIGLTSEKIKWIMLNRVHLLLDTQWLENIVKGVEELEIPRTSDTFMTVTAMRLRDDVEMESRRDLFRSIGWSETEISELLRRQPAILSLSDKTLRVKLKYYMEDLGLAPDYLVKHPTLLTHSIEKRVMPRLAVRQTLMDRNLLKYKIGINGCLEMTQSKFMARFVLPYKEKLPELYENYVRNSQAVIEEEFLY